jgi:uncharacterized integral membrane protein
MTSTEPEPPKPEPDLGSPSTAPGESRQDRARRYGHRTRLYAAAFISVALLAILVILIARNTGAVKLDWAIGSTRASLVWIILAAAVVGWLLGLATAVVFQHRTRRRYRLRRLCGWPDFLGAAGVSIPDAANAPP